MQFCLIQSTEFTGGIMKAVLVAAILIMTPPSYLCAADKSKPENRSKTFDAPIEDVYVAAVQAVGSTLKSAIKEAHTVNFLTASGIGHDSYFGTFICRDAGDGKTVASLSLVESRGNDQIFNVGKTKDKLAIGFWTSLQGYLASGKRQPSQVQSNADPATITIKSMPEGADVTIDGKFVGNAPSVQRLAAGDHKIRISSTGYRDWERTVTVTDGGATIINANLDRVP